MLVYDNETRSIISPLLTVNELRSLAVTLHLGIEAPRDAIPDVSAVYFVRPTPNNIRIITDDAAAGKYRDVSIHFVTPVPRPTLEDFARGCVEAGAVGRIRRVWDQYLNFIALEHRLFTLNMRDSYAAYAHPSASLNDGEPVKAYAKTVAQGLLAVFGAVGAVPIIVHSTGGPAGLVAQQLDESIRDHLASPGMGVFSAAAAAAAAPPLPGRRRPEPLGIGAGARPVLVLLDRDVDMAAPLSHGSTYQSLVDDCLGPINLNRVFVPDDSNASDGGGAGGGAGAGWLAEMLSGAGGGGGKKSAGKSYSLDADTDPFWRNHAADEFPRAIEAHETELQTVVAREETLRRSAMSNIADETTAAAAIALGSGDASSGDLVSAISSLPELMKRKKMLESHSTIMAAVMSRVAARLIPHFTEAEAGALQGSGGWDRSTVLEMVSDRNKGSFDDRLRLAAMYLLTCTAQPKQQQQVGGGMSAGNPLAAGGGSAAAAIEQEADELLRGLQQSVAVQAAGPESGAGANAAQHARETAVLTEAVGKATAVLGYVKQLRTIALSMGAGAFGGAGGGSSGFSLGQVVGGGAGGRILDSFASKATSFISKAAAQVNRLVGGEARLPVTRIVAAVCEGKPSLAPGAGLETNFMVVDPRVASSSGSGVPRGQLYGSFLAASQAAAGPGSGASSSAGIASSAVFRNAFTFIVGGGSYAEAADVQKYASGSGSGGSLGGASSGAAPPESRRTIIYGSTEIVQPGAFLKQIEQLGQAIRG